MRKDEPHCIEHVFGASYIHRTVKVMVSSLWFVFLFVSNIAGNHMNKLAWNFQDIPDMTQEQIKDILEM